MLRSRVFYGLLLFAMGLIYIFTNTYYTLLLFVLTIVLPLLSLALMLFSRRGLLIQLTVPQTCNKERAVFSYRFENTSLLPVAQLTFMVAMENQMNGARKERKVSTTVGGRKTMTADLSITGSRVGTITINTKKIRVYDAFGIFSLRKKDLPEQATVVYPHLRQAAVFMEKPIETTGDGNRYAPEKPGQDVSEIFALREYAPGDEVRKIHWKLSSKLDRTMLRDFSMPLNYSVFLIMDLMRGNEDLVDAEVELYLSISQGLLEQGIHHNLAWFDAGTEEFYVRELSDFEELEIATAQVLASYAGTQPGAALEYYMQSAYRNTRSTLVYVTSQPDVDKIAELSVSQVMRTICIYETKQDVTAQGIEVIPVSVQEVQEGIPEIIV